MAERRSSRGNEARANDVRANDAPQMVLGYLRSRAETWLAGDLRRTRAGLARLAGLTAEQVHDLMNGTRAPTQRSMRAVARALGIGFDDLEQAAKSWANRDAKPAAPAAERYPNRSRAVAAARLVDHDPRDIEAVLAVILPPGVVDPSALVWLRWIDKAREERGAGS